MTVHREIRGSRLTVRTVEEGGGIDTPAAVMGMFAAFGVLVFLGALIGAGAASIPYQLNAFDLEGEAIEMTLIGVAVAVVIVLISFMAGGWAAGRMARGDGGLTGLAMALWAVLLVAIFAALGAFVGAEYNAFQRAGLPDWFSQVRGDDITAIGSGAAIAGVIAVFLGAYVGGRLGEDRSVTAATAVVDEDAG